MSGAATFVLSCNDEATHKLSSNAISWFRLPVCISLFFCLSQHTRPKWWSLLQKSQLVSYTWQCCFLIWLEDFLPWQRFLLKEQELDLLMAISLLLSCWFLGYWLLSPSTSWDSSKRLAERFLCLFSQKIGIPLLELYFDCYQFWNQRDHAQQHLAGYVDCTWFLDCKCSSSGICTHQLDRGP